MESLVQTMHKWHLLNDLPSQMGSTIEGSYIHRRIAVAQMQMEHASEKTLDNRLFNKVRRHRCNSDLMLYGDLMQAKAKRGEEAKEDEA